MGVWGWTHIKVERSSRSDGFYGQARRIVFLSIEHSTLDVDVAMAQVVADNGKPPYGRP